MKIFLLDTNVVSEIWRRQPDSAVVGWFENNEWFLPAPVLAELQEGAESAPSAARRIELNQKIDELVDLYSDALLEWDIETSRIWGRLKHSAQVKRQPQPLWDSLIDAMAVRYGAVIATRNREDFRHAKTFDPWTGSEHAPAQRPV